MREPLMTPHTSPVRESSRATECFSLKFSAEKLGWVCPDFRGFEAFWQAGFFKISCANRGYIWFKTNLGI